MAGLTNAISASTLDTLFPTTGATDHPLVAVVLIAAALAVADADMYRVREVLGCKVEEETHAVAERLLTEIERCVDALKGATK